jgi:hypothetical protein
MRTVTKLPGVVAAILVFTVLVFWIWLVADYVSTLPAYRESGVPRLQWLRWSAFAIPALVLAYAVYVASKAPLLGSILGNRSWWPVRLFVYCIVLAIAATTVAVALGWIGKHGFPASSFFNSSLAISLSLLIYAIIHTHSSARMQGGKWLGILDLGLSNVVFTALLMELVLRQASSFFPNPFVYEPRSAAALIEAHRLPPGSQYFDFNHNSLGYYDDEFTRAGSNDLVIASIADSFGQGVVPHSRNFTTVAERILRERLGRDYRRIAVDNYGTAAVGMPEYLYILQHQVMAYDPTVVLLSVFVGNDIENNEEKGVLTWKAFQGWWLYELPRRYLATVSAGVPHDGEGKSGAGWSGVLPKGIPPYIDHPEKEEPSFPRDRYLSIEANRMQVCDTTSFKTEANYRYFLTMLDRIVDSAAGRLMIAIIPDEFQVNDELYRELLSRHDRPGDMDRDYPQSRIHDYCMEKGLPCLDLLPALRAAAKTQRPYHLNNTHWNSWGNRVAGEAIANFVAARLPPRD